MIFLNAYKSSKMGKIFEYLGYISSFIYTYSFKHKFYYWKGCLYTGWIKRNFKSCGQNCHFGQFRLLKGSDYICLGNGVTMGQNIVLEAFNYYDRTKQSFQPSLIFGDNCSLGDDGHVTCINSIRIGNGVRFGRKVFISDNSHGMYENRLFLDMPPNLRPLYSKGKIVIDDNVWVGEMSCIMPGVHIGYGAVIGANSVVTHDVPAYSVVAGNPARIIKQL